MSKACEPKRGSAPWECFDAWASAAVRREVTFDRFVREADADFGRIARIMAHRKRPPGWVGLDDVKYQLIALAWHYLFDRKSADGTVGFDPTRYLSAGAYCRWKIRTKMGKILSKAKGEHQHRRTGPGAPEYLSKTGELPDRVSEESVEALAERSIEVKKLERICQSDREFAIVRAIAQGLGDERRVVAYLLDNGFVAAEEARRAVDEVVESLEKRVRARPRAAA